MHSKRGRFAAFGARTERVLRDPSHGIDHGIAQIEELLLLLARERIQLAYAMIASEQHLARVRAGARFFRRDLPRLRFAGSSFFSRNFLLFLFGHKFKRRSPRRTPAKT